MYKDSEKLYQVYHTVLSMTLTWALILVVNMNFTLRVNFWISAVYSLIPSALIYLFDMNKKNPISYFLLGGIIPALVLIFWITGTNPLSWLQDIAQWCYYYDGSEMLYAAGYANILIFSAAVLSEILFYLLIKNQMAKIILAFLLFAAMIILSINMIEINKAVVAIAIFYILTIIVEFYGIYSNRKAGREEKKEGILYLAPVCLLLALLSVAMPSRPEPIEWKAFKTIYSNITNQIEAWKVDLEFYFSHGDAEFFVNMAGYSEKGGKLKSGGKLVKNSKVALKLSGLEKNQSVYLVGSVSDIYTGSSWEKSRQDFIPDEKDYLLDYAELFFALSRQDQEVLKNNRFIERKTVKIVYNNIKTNTFFYPNKMSAYDFYSNYDKVTAETPQINFLKARGKGTSYQTIYYEMNLKGEAFLQMLKDEDTFSYKEPHEIDNMTASYVQSTLLRFDNVDNMLETDYYKMLGERAARINDLYTRLPYELPDRVYALAEEITAGYATKYEKLKAIESYLVNHYAYSTSTEKVPQGEDFLDYFLFDSRQGYCTSFATAMAVLGRCIGIPTRYVEGYIGKFETQDKDNMFEVKSSNAHAWAEAYLEGIGWIPFEATSPYYNVRYTDWKEITVKEDDLTAADLSQFNQAPQGMQQNQPIIPVHKKDDSSGIVYGIIIIFIIVTVLTMIVVIYYNILKFRYKRNFEKADYSRKMYMQLLRILRLLKREGFILGPQETILMLAERVHDRFHYDRVTFPDVANIYMRYRYAQEEITKKEYEQVAVYQLGLSNKERDEESRLKVWMAELIFLTKKSPY